MNTEKSKETFVISDEELTDIMIDSFSKAEDNCHQYQNEKMEKETNSLISKEDEASVAWVYIKRLTIKTQ